MAKKKVAQEACMLCNVVHTGPCPDQQSLVDAGIVDEPKREGDD